MTDVLLVLNEQERDLRERVEKIDAEPDIYLDRASHIARAVDRMSRRRYDYVVCGIELAEDGTSAVQPCGGIDLCSAVRKVSQVPIVVLVPHISNDIQLRCAAVGAPHAVPLAVDATLRETLLVRIRALRPARRRLDVIIDSRSDRPDWEYHLLAEGFDYAPKSGVLRIGSALLRSHKNVSAMLASAADWPMRFRELGQALIDGFCETNEGFAAQLTTGISEAGGLENTRVTFCVGRESYEIALEAILRPDKIPDPWMIHAPLLRNVSGPEPAPSDLFDGPRRALRCLVICADTEGYVDEIKTRDGQALHVSALQMVERECRIVDRLLRRPSNSRALSVEVIGGARNPVSVKGLRDALRRNWDVVHFAGHSHFEAHENGSGSGYLLVGEKDKPQAVPIKDVAPYLRNSRLLYLSSCESGNADFAIEAAKAGVPAVIGFRWAVRDCDAAVHAALFYRQLLRHNAIDTAFWGVRRAMHRQRPLSNIWASAMLVTGRQ